MVPLPAPAEKPSRRVFESQSHANASPPAVVAVLCAALWRNLQPALTTMEIIRVAGICAVNSIVSELRTNGADINCR